MRHLLHTLLVPALLLAGCASPYVPPCSGNHCDGGTMDGSNADGANPDGSTTDAVATDTRRDVVARDTYGEEVVSIAITPDNPTLTAADGATATQAFTATATRRDGTTFQLTGATWTLANTTLGTIDGAGLFTANGVTAGSVTVTAEAPVGPSQSVLSSSTTLTVRITRTLASPDAPADAATRFANAEQVVDGTRSANVLYPLDGARMPNNVIAPDVQWENGAAGDLYRVTVAKPHVAVTAYVLHSGDAFKYDWQVDTSAWHAVADSDQDDPVVITVDRLDAAANQVLLGTPVTVHLAHSAIFGRMYYWDLSDGRLWNVASDTAQRSLTIPNPPPRARDGSRCVACHVISHDGRYLAAEMWDGGDRSAVFDLTRADLGNDPAPTTYDPLSRPGFLFASFNNDDTRLVINPADAPNTLAMIDPLSGASVATNNLAPGINAAHPAWSPDGSAIAFIANTNGGWAVSFTNGDLAVIDQTAPDTFGPVNTLHTGASLLAAPEGGAADSHPTWSPDSRFIAFGHAYHSRSDNDDQGPIPGSLYIIARAGGDATLLANAVGPGSPTSFWPTFSPFVTVEPDGTHYYWMAFHSRRDYGNAQAGTRGTQRRQLWVSAIVDRLDGSDPSSVPYWVPGQDVGTNNMAAYWAPEPCRPNGNTCSVSSECCSGQCLPDPNSPGQSTCQPPPSTDCHHQGATCGGQSDCCNGLVCNGNVCDQPPPG